MNARHWGGYSVGNPTLKRFYALHYLLPFVIAGLVVLHVWALHVVGQNNPTGIEIKAKSDSVPMAPYAIIGMGVVFVLLPGENMTFTEGGRWTHRDQNGAEYPPVGLGAYTGFPVGFMKSGTASDAAGYWYCTSKDAGFPGAWSPGSPGVNGRVTDGAASGDYGCIPITNAVSGGNYLTEIQMAASVNHSHLLFDCLWVNSGLSITTTTAQAITMPTLPARDINGTTNGEGCMIAILCTAAVGLAAVASNATSTLRSRASLMSWRASGCSQFSSVKCCHTRL